MFNIFEHFRGVGLNVFNESLVKIESPDPTLPNDLFCEHNGIAGTAATALIDGNNHTAYANLDISEPNQWVVIQFVYTPVYIHTLYFYSLCGPPKDLKIEGSNDNKKWEIIRHYNIPIADDSMTPIPCYKRKLFKYIKLSQTINQANNYRFHIHHIEIYGTIGKLEICSHLHKEHRMIYPLFLIIILS